MVGGVRLSSGFDVDQAGPSSRERSARKRYQGMRLLENVQHGATWRVFFDRTGYFPWIRSMMSVECNERNGQDMIPYDISERLKLGLGGAVKVTSAVMSNRKSGLILSVLTD
ncbi:hypothetical protein ES703_87328 [subsurface metagenome]